MLTNLYTTTYLKLSKKINYFCLGRKIATYHNGRTLILPKGIFFRVLTTKTTQIGLIAGRFVSSRKPFVRPVKEVRR